MAARKIINDNNPEIRSLPIYAGKKIVKKNCYQELSVAVGELETEGF